MRQLLLALLPLLLHVSALMTLAPPANATDADTERAAVAFVNALSDGRYEDAAQSFDDTMTAALPPAKLGATWRQVEKYAGAFRGVAATRTELLGDSFAVFVHCRFARAELDAKIVFTKGGKITGLFFVPPAPAEMSWQAPPYVDAARLHEVDVVVGEEWPLPAKLTLPRADGQQTASGSAGKKLPALVLVHGSGPHDLDETIGPNKPFKDLAQGLASRGIAVLRYEKRTKVHGARLAREVKNFTLDDETVDDAVKALESLAGRPEVDNERIFILGHSLGGTAAPRIAGRSKQVAGVIVWAGSTRSLGDIVVDQVDYIARLDGTVDVSAAEIVKSAKAFRAAAASPSLLAGDVVDMLGAKLPGSYLIDFRSYDAARAASELSQPMLILHNARDYQVNAADLEGWRRGLKAKQNAEVVVLAGLNHLGIVGTSPSTPAEYAIPGHVDVSVIDAIVRWLKP